MKASEKEKRLLGILLIVLVGFCYYQFGYLKFDERIAELTAEKNTVEAEYNEAIKLVETLPIRKKNIEVVGLKIDDILKVFYPKLSQEHIILELDQLLNDSGLEGNISFSPATIGIIEDANKGESENLIGSLYETVENYNDLFDVEGSSKDNTPIKQEESVQDNTTKDTVEQKKISISFTGTYYELQKFLLNVDERQKRIVVNSISISSKSIDEITGVMELELYAVPKPADKDTEYLLWEIENTYGKSSPFSGAGGSSSTIEDSVNKKDSYDFIISSKASASDLPSIMMGKANDESKLSYVYDDSDKVENVEIVLSKKNDRYYVKYKTKMGSYPSSYNGDGVEFLPTSDDNIVLQIVSEKRIGANDKNGIVVKVVNNTDKAVKTIIKDDDQINPRVKVQGTGNKVDVENE